MKPEVKHTIDRFGRHTFKFICNTDDEMDVWHEKMGKVIETWVRDNGIYWSCMGFGGTHMHFDTWEITINDDEHAMRFKLTWM